MFTASLPLMPEDFTAIGRARAGTVRVESSLRCASRTPTLP